MRCSCLRMATVSVMRSAGLSRAVAPQVLFYNFALRHLREVLPRESIRCVSKPIESDC